MVNLKWAPDTKTDDPDEDSGCIEDYDDIETLDQLGPSPIFKFMPNKVQVMKMILKAAYYWFYLYTE